MGRRVLRRGVHARGGQVNEPALMGGVVAFDFDGTLTIRDSFMAFLRWRSGGARYALGLVRLAPAAFAYLFDRNRGRLKAAAVREFLKGVPRATLEEEARRFAETTSGDLLRPDALRVWREWRSREAKLVIVTASPDVLVAPFARGLAAHTLIATKLAFDADDRVAGGFDGANCRAAEKVRRLREVFGADLRLKAAYGDTSGDREMLTLAEEKGYRVFTEKP
ncbi:HAD-IB family hydrolase [Phenylobacterium sp.]|uniref:HAD-IB family hydrolase n=1 Tax=Phenylobacterium sp. TaxID=1871053 RepID=UPI0035B3F059